MARRVTQAAKVFTDAEMVDALRKSAGLVSIAARLLGCNRRTIQTRAHKSKAVREAIDDCREETLDLAESSLRKAIIKGESWAVCFALKTIGRIRGFNEHQEQRERSPREVAQEIITITQSMKELSDGPGAAQAVDAHS